MARAHVRNAEMEQWRVAVGRALQRAMELRGWSLKEFAAAVDRDERQCARWIAGAERPQLDTLFAVPELRQVLVVAFAELVGDSVEVTTVVTVKRTL